MSVSKADGRLYGSVRMPANNTVTDVGGGIDRSTQVIFGYPTSGTCQAVSSDSSDTGATRWVDVTGRLTPAGTPATERILLSGTTPVSGAQTFGAITRIDKNTGATYFGDIGVMIGAPVATSHTARGGSQESGTTAPRALLQTNDGTLVSINVMMMRFTDAHPPQLQYTMRRLADKTADFGDVTRNWPTGGIPTATSTYDMYYGAVLEKLPVECFHMADPLAFADADIPGGSSRTYAAKVYWDNQDASVDLTAAQIIKASDPGGGLTLDFALALTLNDNGTNGTSNTRLVAPNSSDNAITGWSVGTAPQTINVQDTGNLAAAGASPQGVWLRLTVPAGTAPQNNKSYNVAAEGDSV